MTGSGMLSDSGVHPSGVLRRRLVHPLALLAVTWAAACGGDGGTTEPAPAPQPNRPPVASGSIPPQTMTAGESATVSVGGLFSDPDGDALTLTAISSNAGVASVALSGTNLNITAVAAGSATVTVTARDPAGLSSAASANVTVMEPNRAPEADPPIASEQTAHRGRHSEPGCVPILQRPGRRRADLHRRKRQHSHRDSCFSGGQRGVRRGGGRRFDHAHGDGNRPGRPVRLPERTRDRRAQPAAGDDAGLTSLGEHPGAQYRGRERCPVLQGSERARH